jgi:hypothetical protein
METAMSWDSNKVLLSDMNEVFFYERKILASDATTGDNICGCCTTHL